MIRAAGRHLALTWALAGLVAASCAGGSDHAVGIKPHADRYLLTFRAGRLEGQCYAPRTIDYNGALDLSDFPGANRWTVIQADPAQVGRLDYMLSGKRERIGRTVTLPVPRSSVFVRPFYVQFIAFPCDAPTSSRAWTGKVPIVSVSADLPPYYPEGYREAK